MKKSMYLVYDNVAQYSGIATRQIVCTCTVRIGVAHGGSGGAMDPPLFCLSGCGSGNCYAHFVDAHTRLI